MTSDHQNVKEILLDELEELIYQCKNRFSNRYELATENEEVVRKLCLCLELILSHGLRKSNKSNKLLNGILPGSTANKENLSLWTFLKQFLTEHETQRFLLLRCVQSDNGRSSSWIRNALNEHTFQRYISTILDDSGRRRPTFYHEWALLLDPACTSQFLSHLTQLNSILFALNIDNADLNICDIPSSLSSSPPSTSALLAVSPSSSSASTSANNQSASVTSSSARVVTNRIISSSGSARDGNMQLLVPNSSKRSHFVTINDSSDYGDSDCEVARSAPNTTSFLNHSPVDFSVNSSTAHLPSSSSSTPPPQPPAPLPSSSTVLPPAPSHLLSSSAHLRPSPSPSSSSVTAITSLKTEARSSLPAKSSSSSSLNVTDSGMVLIPICDQDTTSSSLSPSAASGVSPTGSSLTHLPEETRKRLVGLESERDKLDRENTLLKIQLKKYIAAIELLKFNRVVAEENVKKDEEPSENSQNYIRDYENKLVKVSQMHGELVEFNDYLYKVIQQKDSIIARLRDELVELRGPLPETEDIMSTSADGEQQSSLQSLVQIPLIHIWIPTAFLSGGFKGKSHHIYQIYIRIKEEEWNVYRRYSQFYSLHKTLKTTHRPIGEFEFPPKKAIGNKDSKVVQERRKKLEFYLRNVINHMQSLNSEITNKDKLVQAIPFLSDKFFLQDRSHSETNLAQQTQSTTTQPYMGF